MRINALRKELKDALASCRLPRPPVLRRSLQEDWLYATDLPGICEREQLDGFCSGLAGAGWEIMEEQGWIQFRKPTQEPPEGWFEGSFGPEASCCLSLAERHPGGADGTRAQCLLVKAGETGEAAYEETCARLHREWAALLREGKQPPALSRRWFSV